MTKLTNALIIQDKGKFPSQPPPNPKIQFGLDEETPSKLRFDKVKPIMVLRSGKVINKPNKKIEEGITS